MGGSQGTRRRGGASFGGSHGRCLPCGRSKPPGEGPHCGGRPHAQQPCGHSCVRPLLFTLPPPPRLPPPPPRSPAGPDRDLGLFADQPRRHQHPQRAAGVIGGGERPVKGVVLPATWPAYQVPGADLSRPTPPPHPHTHNIHTHACVPPTCAPPRAQYASVIGSKELARYVASRNALRVEMAILLAQVRGMPGGGAACRVAGWQGGMLGCGRAEGPAC